MKKNKFIIHSHQSGFTLLFAVLISTLVVSISATIISIALRQTILSGTSRESQYAFYAANTALDCAHYWDTKSLSIPNTFVFPAPSPASDLPIDPSLIPDIVCSGVNIITGEGNGVIPSENTPWEQDFSTINTTTFKLKITNQADSISNLPAYNYCADVTVTKTFDSVDAVIITRIEARGYNTCDENNTRRVERSVISQYES